MPHDDHLIGVALGAPHEPAGLVMVRRTETLGEFDARRKRYRVHLSFQVAAITSLARSGDLAAAADAVLALRPPLIPRQRLAVPVDISSSGRAVLGLLRDRGLKPIPVMISGEVGAKPGRQAFQLGRAELVAGLGITLRERRLGLERTLPGAGELAQQMERARVGKPAAGQEEPRAELVDALALALWWGSSKLPPRIEQPRPPAAPIDVSPPTFDQVMEMRRSGRY